MVVMKRTPANQFRAMPLQLYAETHHQPFDSNFLL
jgi:hypothetical protein